MKHRNTKPRKFRKPEEPFRVNERIRALEVRLIGENIPPGVFSRAEALRIAENAGEDLVEVAPTASPPVCKVMSYSKFKYERKKKLKEISAKSQKTIVKEIRLTPRTDKHDIAFKTKHAIKFLEEGAKVETYVQFRGREAYTLRKEGEEKLRQLSEQLADYGKPDGSIRAKGRRSMLTIIPHPKNK